MPEVIRIGGQQARRLVQGALDKLEAALRAGESETLKAYLRTMSRFARYSLGNILLIASQRPGATHVAGFHAWRRLGRHVRRRERGIAILAPIVWRRTSHRETPQQPIEAGGSPEREVTNEGLAGFKTAHVFDISQTDGKPLPELSHVQGDPREHVVGLRRFAEDQGIRVEYVESLGGADGASQGGTIKIRSGLSSAEEFSTVAHELGHALLHRDGQERSRSVKETEAEAVAFVVCEAIGLESNGASADYIQLHEGKIDTLLASLRRVRDAALPIIESLGVGAMAAALRRCGGGSLFVGRTARKSSSPGGL